MYDPKTQTNPYKQKAQKFTEFSLSFLETNENPQNENFNE